MTDNTRLGRDLEELELRDPVVAAAAKKLEDVTRKIGSRSGISWTDATWNPYPRLLSGEQRLPALLRRDHQRRSWSDTFGDGRSRPSKEQQ